MINLWSSGTLVLENPMSCSPVPSGVLSIIVKLSHSLPACLWMSIHCNHGPHGPVWCIYCIYRCIYWLRMASFGKSDPDLLEKILGPLLAVQTAPLAITLTAPMLDRYSIGDLKKCKKVISENGSHMFPLCFNLFRVSVHFMTYGHCASLWYVIQWIQGNIYRKQRKPSSLAKSCQILPACSHLLICL